MYTIYTRVTTEIVGNVHFVQDKVQFHEDATVKTGIKWWNHSGSQLKGAPTLTEMKKKVYQESVPKDC